MGPSVTKNGMRPLALPECKCGRRNTAWLSLCCLKSPELIRTVEGDSFSGGAAGVVVQFPGEDCRCCDPIAGVTIQPPPSSPGEDGRCSDPRLRVNRNKLTSYYCVRG